MIRRLYISLIISVVLPIFSSCRAISSFLANDEVVAQVGQEKLYRGDIDKVIPRGLEQEDSVRMTHQYINSWASDRVFLKIAEQQLSKAEKDVTHELEDYRKSLLKYRYELLYVNERLDTSVTRENIEEYYLAHADNFILERPILKARFLNIAADSPNLKPIRKKMASTEAVDVMEADSLSFSSAIKFTTWSDKWIDATVLAREYVMDYSDMLSRMNRGWIETTDTTGYTRLAYITQIMQKGMTAPLEFCEDKIRDIIISSRKQNLIMNLEQDLLKDALENGQYIIY